MKSKLILNTVKLNGIKDFLSPHLYQSEFLLKIFPQTLNDNDESNLLHFIFQQNDIKKDSRAKTRFMDGNTKIIKENGIPTPKRDYVNALKFIALMLQNNNVVLQWVEHLQVNYPNLEYFLLQNIATMDSNLYPEKFKNIILSENDKYYLLLFLICWSVFGEQIETCNFKPSTEYLKTNILIDVSDDETFFQSILSIPENIQSIDLAYHSGYKWCFDRKRSDLLTGYLASGGKLRVIVNSPKAAEKIAKHTRSVNRSYVGFKSSITAWKNLQSKNPSSVEIVVSDLPLLHSYANFKFKNGEDSKMLVIFYTYNNPAISDNYHLHLTPTSKEYAIFEQEFEYLWGNNNNSPQRKNKKNHSSTPNIAK